jgi:hypothetical protein
MKFQYFLHCIFVIPQLFFYKSNPSCVLKKLQQVLSLLISNLLDKTAKKQSYMKVYHKISGSLTNFDNLSHSDPQCSPPPKTPKWKIGRK